MGRHRYTPGKRSVNVVSAKLLRTARTVSQRLADSGYAHALIGGLAVSAHGYKRTTSDVDFLVTAEAEVALAGDALGGEARGKTIVVDGVTVDLLFPNSHENFLEGAINRSVGKVPVIPKETLVYLKLTAGRMKDAADVVELLKRGKLNPQTVVRYLQQHQPDLIEEFESLVSLAQHETD